MYVPLAVLPLPIVNWTTSWWITNWVFPLICAVSHATHWLFQTFASIACEEGRIPGVIAGSVGTSGPICGFWDVP